MKALIKKYSGEFLRIIANPVAPKNKTLIRTQISVAHIQQNLEFAKKNQRSETHDENLKTIYCSQVDFPLTPEFHAIFCIDQKE